MDGLAAARRVVGVQHIAREPRRPRARQHRPRHRGADRRAPHAPEEARLLGALDEVRAQRREVDGAAAAVVADGLASSTHVPHRTEMHPSCVRVSYSPRIVHETGGSYEEGLRLVVLCVVGLF